MASFIELSPIGFRNLKDQQVISFDSKLNFIIGENGSGKSNLIEALHFFSHSRSFRGARTDDVIQNNQSSFTLFAKLSNHSKAKASIHHLGIYRDCYYENLIKIDGQKLDKYSDLARQVPTKILSSDKPNLLDSSPKQRRQEIDWQLFHVKHQNLKLFSELSLTLKNKNVLLKNYALSQKQISQEIEPWNLKLSELSVAINQERKKILDEVIIEFKELINKNQLNKIQGIEIELTSGYPKSLDWQNEAELFKFLSLNNYKEKKINQSLYGPQRADLIFYINDNREKLAKDYYSKGQKKLVSLYFSLAQILVLNRQQKKAIFLLDDIYSELDSSNFHHFIKLLCQYDFQCMITIPKKSFAQMRKYGKIFEIKDGQIKSH